MRLTTTSLRPALLAFALLPSFTTACGGDAEPKPSSEAKTEASPAPKPKAPVYYDAEGRLLESDQSVAGVAVPVGFTAVPHHEARTTAFVSTVIPLEKVIAYYGPRLFTGQIERLGAGVSYVDAVPMGKRSAGVSMDVRISPTDRREVRVTIHEHARPPLVAPSIEELQKTLQREQKQIE